MGAKSMRISFNTVNGFIRVYEGPRYLVLSRGKKCDFIYNN